MGMTIEKIIQELKSPYPTNRANAIEVVDVLLKDYEHLLRNYEHRIKSDMVVMLNELNQSIIAKSWIKDKGDVILAVDLADVNEVIQQKINALKENIDGNDDKQQH